MTAITTLRQLVEMTEQDATLLSDTAFFMRVVDQIQAIDDIAALDGLVQELYQADRTAGQYLIRALRSVFALNEDPEQDQAWLLTAIPIETSAPLTQTGVMLRAAIDDALTKHAPGRLTPTVFARPCLLSEVSSMVATAELMFGSQLYTMVGSANQNVCVWPILWRGRIEDVETFNTMMHQSGKGAIPFDTIIPDVEAFAKFCGIGFRIHPMTSWENAFSICRAIELRLSMMKHIQELRSGAEVAVDDNKVVLKTSNAKTVLAHFSEESPAEVSVIANALAKRLVA